MQHPKTNIFNINGLKIIHIPLLETGVVFSSINVKIGAGAEDFDFPCGTAHFVEHMLCRGTRSFPTESIIYEKIESLGCNKNAQTAFAYTRYYNTVLKENIKDALLYIIETFCHPIIPKEKFETEKKVIIEESKRAHTDPKRISLQNTYKVLYKIPRSEELILGSVSSIEKITYEDIVNFYKKYYNKNNVNLFVCGDLSFIELQNVINNIDFNIENTSSDTYKIPEATINGEYMLFEVPNRKNLSISINYKIPSIGKSGYDDAGITGYLFSINKGPGYRKLRQEQGLTYSISANRGENSLSIEFETDQVNEKIAIDSVKEVLKELAENGINDLDFKKVISTWKFNHLTKLGNIIDFGMTHSYNFMMYPNLKSLEEYYNIIYSPTQESVQKQIKEMIKNEPTIVITK